MAESESPIYMSPALEEFLKSYLSTVSKEEKDMLWDSINTPFIEEISGDSTHHLVTFLYRQANIDSKDQLSIYLQCDAVGLPFSEKNQLKPIPKTDIYFLSLILPSRLRTAYTFLKVKHLSFKSKENSTHNLFPYPKFIDPIWKIFDLISTLHEEKNIVIDDKNPHQISYLDYNDLSVCFTTESILELPLTIKEDKDFFDLKIIKRYHDTLIENKQLSECLMNFAETSLKDVPEYKLPIEDKTEIQRGITRKYWIYRPSGFTENADKSYPFFLFLDGSDYLGNIPALSILETMINSESLPPCIAIFFDYSPDRRLLEYYCDKKFTYFLAHDLIKILQTKHHLRITDDPKLTTIVGFSASGLAALYTGLTYPTVFGNVITQSAALWSIKKKSLENMIDEFRSLNKKSCFIMEAGLYEDVPIACQFKDCDTQAISINQSNKQLVDYMTKKGINASFHEFIGGHNYVCWRNSLMERFYELYKIRFIQ